MKTFTTNLIGPLIVSIAFVELYSELAEHTKQQPTVITPPGRIVSISSKAAHTSLRGYGAYCASKAGLNSLTHCMAKEWADRGIISNIISSNTAMVPLEEQARGDRESSDDTLAPVSDSQAS
jgi:NAD(P)-dependent dehydrogenase (short-subunit alcohol dehydrogenase family)